MNNLVFLLALNRMNGVGSRTVAKLKQRWPDLQELFNRSTTDLELAGLSAKLAHTISNFDLNKVDEDLKWLNQATNNHLLTWESAEYPPLLKEISDPPVVLYAKGQLSALNQPTCAIVGSRNPSITGSENARYFAQELAACGITIVSGLALGIDAQAHWGCLAAGGATVAVLGTGIDCIYPRRHLKLAQEITENGLLVSEFPLKSQPIAGHFPQRNRIISGLSLSTLVVEAAVKSGSLITARMALEQNRDVLAIPGSIHNPMARGCHYLLQQGAKLVTSVSDVLDEMKIAPLQLSANTIDNVPNRGEVNDFESKEIPNRTENDVSPLASSNKNLVQFVGYETTTVDQIVIRSGLDVEHVISELTQLELSGSITSAPGGYIRCTYER